MRCACVCASVSEYDRFTLYPEDLGLLCERKKGGEGVGLFKANTVDKVDAGGGGNRATPDRSNDKFNCLASVVGSTSIEHHVQDQQLVC